jgi:hypothetical protein
MAPARPARAAAPVVEPACAAPQPGPAVPVPNVPVPETTVPVPEITVPLPEITVPLPEATVPEAGTDAPAGPHPPRRPGLLERLRMLFQPRPAPPPEQVPAPATPLPTAHAPEQAVPPMDACPDGAAEPASADRGIDPVAVLTGALDSLGQAHHRPFSRA